MKLLLTVTALALALSGCGHYNYYSKANVPTQQIAQDLYECKQASMRNYSAGSVLSTPNVATSGVYASGLEPNEGMTNLCMQARGYTVTDEETLNAQKAERVKQAEYQRKVSTSPPQSQTYSDDHCDAYAKVSSTAPYADEYARCMRILGK